MDVLLPLPLGLIGARELGHDGALALVLLTLLVTLAAVLGVTWRLHRYGRYSVQGDILTIRRQWETRRIPLSSVSGVRRRGNVGAWTDFANDFALGSRVMEIQCTDGTSALVSPLDDRGFLQAIGHPHIPPPDRVDAPWVAPVAIVGLSCASMALWALCVYAIQA